MTNADKAALYGSIGVIVYAGVCHWFEHNVSYSIQDVLFGIFMTWFLSHYYD